MKLANVIKESVNEITTCLNSHLVIEKTSLFIYEHPLNHGRRLGVIRLNNKSLETFEVIEQVQQQFIKWQKDEKIVGVWFESKERKTSSVAEFLNNKGIEEDKKIELMVSALIKQIKASSKVSVLWCDQVYSSSLSYLFDAVTFPLVHTSSRYHLIKKYHSLDASSAKLKLCHISHNQEKRERVAFIDVYPIACQRSRVLELLSSHPWQKQSCMALELRFSQLFEESLGLL